MSNNWIHSWWHQLFPTFHLTYHVIKRHEIKQEHHNPLINVISTQKNMNSRNNKQKSTRKTQKSCQWHPESQEEAPSPDNCLTSTQMTRPEVKAPIFHSQPITILPTAPRGRGGASKNSGGGWVGRHGEEGWGQKGWWWWWLGGWGCGQGLLGARLVSPGLTPASIGSGWWVNGMRGDLVWEERLLKSNFPGFLRVLGDESPGKKGDQQNGRTETRF